MCGGWFAANKISGDSTTSIVVGLGIIAIPTAWSWIAKWFHLDNTLPYKLGTSETLRTLLGALVSQGITALSTYFAIDANHPELLLAALANAGAAKMGLHQKIAFMGAQDALKVLPVCICVLSLSSCAGAMALLANPAVDNAAISLVELGLDEAVSRGVVTPGQVVTIKKAGAVITDPNDSTISKAVKLEDIGLDVAVAAGKLNPGDSLLIKKATAIVTSAANAAPSAKQPVSVVPVKTASARIQQPTECRRSQSIPACMQIAGGVPLYGERVAFVLRTGDVK